jgi:NAD+ kinase
MKKICILTKTKKPGVIGAMAQVQKFFVKRNYQVFTKLDRNILKKGLAWIIVLGGDGAMLHMANKVAVYEIPLIGVNFGHKGYLCEIAKDKIRKGLSKLHNASFSITDYTRVRARVFKAKKIVKEIDALNEIVVGGINRMVWL